MIAVVSGEIATRALIGDVSAFTAMLKIQHEREAIQDNAKESPASVTEDTEDYVDVDIDMTETGKDNKT